jgi:co-chaperonin GroES (HSP10)
MSKSKLPQPIGARILIKLDEVKIAGMDVSLNTARETATVLAIGEGWDLKAEPLKVGDKIHVKSWSLDIVSEGEDTFIYVWQKTGGVCAVIK